MQKEKILSRAVLGEYIEVNCNEPNKKEERREKLTYNWDDKTPVDWFKFEEPYLHTLEIKDSDLVYLGDGRFELTFWRNGNNIQLTKPNDKSDCTMFVIRLQIEVKRDDKDFNKGYWDKTYKHNSDFSIESVKTPEELATEWSNATSQDAQLDAYNFATVQFFLKRECKTSLVNAYNIRTIAALNTACEFAHRGVFRNRYAYAIAALAMYCDSIIESLVEKFPYLSDFLDALQENKFRRADEVVGTVSEWCDNIYAELSAADSK